MGDVLMVAHRPKSRRNLAEAADPFAPVAPLSQVGEG